MTYKPAKNNQSQIIHQEAYFSGPLPTPEMLARYDAVVPGAADRIIKMAENQSAHRIEIEKTVINTRSRDSLLGIVSGLLIGLCSLAASVYAIVNGHSVAGGLMGTTGIAGLVSVFIYGTRENRAERERKAQINPKK